MAPAGRVEQGSIDNGRTLFGEKCGSCHTLEAAGTTSEIGPNLDAVLRAGALGGVRGELDPRHRRRPDPRAGPVRDRRWTGPCCRPTCRRIWSTGQDLADVASFVAANAGKNGFVQPVAVSGTNGKTIFVAKCGGCHTLKAAGTTGTAGPNLDQLKPPFDRAKQQVINGGGIMPAFKGVLTDAQIDAVAKYVAEQAGKSKK